MSRTHRHDPLRLSARAASALILATSILPLGAAPAWAHDLTIEEQLTQAAEQGLRSVGNQAYSWSDGNDPIGLQADLPASYDLRDEGVVTPVKLQNPWGTCWGFSAIAASETSILSELKAAGQDYSSNSLFYDLSERQLAWFAYSPIPEGDDSGQGGEGMYNIIDQDVPFNSGGLPVYATSIFSSGIGPLSEEQAPYRNDEGIIDYYTDANGNQVVDEDGNPIPMCYAMEGTWKLDESLRYQQVIDLEETYVLPVPATITTNDDGTQSYTYNADATAAIKEQLMEGRAVSIAFCADQSMPGKVSEQAYLNPDTWAHYTYQPAQANHAVAIVGWDDSYSKENFTEGHQPPADGAWIVKNSWGASDNEFPNQSSWGADGSGYFYLSYYDQSISLAEAFDYNIDGIGTREAYYANQYDYMPASTTFAEQSADKLSTANVFTAEDDQIVTTLTCETSAPGTTVTYELYHLNDGYTSPTDGEKVAEITETYEYGGFHRAELSEEQQLELPKGDAFSVVITQKVGDEYRYTVDSGLTESGIEQYRNMLRDRFVLSVIDQVTAENPGLSEEEILELCYKVVDEMIAAGAFDSIMPTAASNAVVNEGESFAYADGKWTDETELIETTYNDGSGIYTFDNYTIKAYSDELERPFADVEPGEWYFEAATWAKGNGVMHGYGDGTTFGPEDVLTREQAAVVLWNAIGGGEVVGSRGMSDVDEGEWYADAVNWCVANHVMDGYGGGVFGVGDVLTREQLACTVAKAVGGTASDPGAAAGLPDAGEVSDWAADGVAWAVENGVIAGVEVDGGRELQPQGEVTRGQMAAIIMNAVREDVLELK